MHEKFRVLHLISGLETGGAATALFNLLRGGLADRFNSKVVSLRDLGTMGSRLDSLGVPVSALGIKKAIPSPSSLIDMRREVREFRPDLLQGWMYHGNLAASVSAKLAFGSPATSWNIRHSLYDLSAEKPTTRLIIRGNRLLSDSPNLIIYNSEISRRQHQTFGFERANGHVIPNGFDTSTFQPNTENTIMIRESLGIPQESVVVGHVARFHPMKNHVGFLRAAAYIGTTVENVHFVLAGSDVEPSNSELHMCVPESLQNRFHFLGDRRDVPKLMSAFDILCQSSIWGEAFPNVLGEAMAAGVPCVATDVGDSATIVGETGFIVQPRDDKSLTDALIKMLAMSSDDRVALGVAARTRVKNHYSLDAVVNEYSIRYDHILRRA